MTDQKTKLDAMTARAQSAMNLSRDIEKLVLASNADDLKRTFELLPVHIESEVLALGISAAIAKRRDELEQILGDVE